MSQIIKLLMCALCFLFSLKSLASEAASGEVSPDPGSPHALSRFLMLQASGEAAEQILLSFTITPGSGCLLHSLQHPPTQPVKCLEMLWSEESQFWYLGVQFGDSS